jgi:hypothetical protein
MKKGILVSLAAVALGVVVYTLGNKGKEVKSIFKPKNNQ